LASQPATSLGRVEAFIVRTALLAFGLGLVYIVVLVTPVFANYSALVTPGAPERQVMLLTLPLWFLSLRTIWRTKLFERSLAVGDRE
jgi:hypothetical protein